MGKCIERVRAQRALAGKNRLEQWKHEAFCRHLDQLKEAPGSLVFVAKPPEPEPRRWWEFWRAA